ASRMVRRFVARRERKPTRARRRHALCCGMPDPAVDSNVSSSRYAWYVAGVLALANVSGNIDRQILGLLVKPIEADLGITDTQMSLLQGFAFAIFYALLGIPIARLADRTNRRNSMAAGTALWSVFTALQGL